VIKASADTCTPEKWDKKKKKLSVSISQHVTNLVELRKRQKKTPRYVTLRTSIDRNIQVPSLTLLVNIREIIKMLSVSSDVVWNTKSFRVNLFHATTNKSKHFCNPQIQARIKSTNYYIIQISI
jgi:hypothetical protein